MLHATLVDTERDHAAEVILWHQNVGTHDRLAHFLDHRGVGQQRRVINVDNLTALLLHLEHYGRGGGNQIQIVLALQALLDDLHVQHAEETDTEAKTQCLGAFRLELQRSIVQRQLLQRLAKILEIIRTDRKQAGINLRLDLLEPRQRIDIRGIGQGQGIAHRRTMNVLDTGDNEAYFTGLQVNSFGMLGVEHADAVDQMGLAGRLDQHLVTLLDPAMLDAHQRHHAKVVVEPGINDQCLQRCFDLAFRRRNGVNQRFEHILDTDAALRRAGNRICRVNADYAFNLGLDPLRLGLGQVDLVQHRHDLKALLDSGVAVGYRLRLHTLRSVHHQQRALAGSERAADFVVKVHVTWGINKVQLVGLAVFGGVIQRDAVCLDGDTTLALQIHGVEYLRFHFTLAQATADLDKAVGQRRLAVVDVGNDGKITNQAKVTHSADHPDRVARHGETGRRLPKTAREFT